MSDGPDPGSWMDAGDAMPRAPAPPAEPNGHLLAERRRREAIARANVTLMRPTGEAIARSLRATASRQPYADGRPR